jgi:hypothetical protein
MSQEGWEVSFDGAANAFVMKNSVSDVPTEAGQTELAGGFKTFGGVAGGNDDTSIVTGLLPNVWGMTLKAPTANGLDISARLGLYTHMNGGQNSLGNGEINIRETSGSVSGSFGTVLVGRSLGIHQSNAILNDMLLFGVGAAASAGNSNTTLGRIGLGYLYTDFKPQISWTLPGYDALGGSFGAKIGIFDPDDIVADVAAYSATDKHAPRVEAQITYNGGIGDLGINLWVDGSYQNTERTEAESAIYSNNYGAPTSAAGVPSTDTSRESDVDSAAVGFGTKLSYQGFSIVASGFYGTAMGVRGQHATQGLGANGALDPTGNVRQSYGGYLQGTYDFGQGTSAGYSYGGNCLRRTERDMFLYTPNDGSQATGIMNCQTMHSGMVWHNVTDNFRLVAEGGFTEKTWYLADTEQEDSFGGVGAFFFW